MRSAALPDDSKKTKARLVAELRRLRARVADLETSRKHYRREHVPLKTHASILDLPGILMTAGSIDDICTTALAQAKKLTGSSVGFVTYIEPVTGSIRMSLSREDGRKCQMIEKEMAHRHSEGLWSWSLQQRKTLICNEPAEDPRSAGLPEGHIPIRRFLAVPAVCDEDLVGQISVANARRAYTQYEAALLEKLAELFATAVKNHERLDELHNSERRYKQLSQRLEAMVGEQAALLRQNESLAEMGRMVSSVAHEIRNVLHIIQMGAESMRMEIKDDPKKLKILQEIEYGVSVLNAAGRELLDYAKPVQLECSTCSLKGIIENALAAAGNKLRSVRLDVNLEEDMQIHVDGPKITRALLNVISNAVEAMPYEGRISISSSSIHNNECPSLMLAVQDTGCGIAEQDLERVQQPFVTTKEYGTGLGISICKRIIEAHGGRFSLDSKPGEGTRVEIHLPLDRAGQPLS